MHFLPASRNDRWAQAAARFARVRSALLLALLGVACLTALAGTFAAAAGASPGTAYVTNYGSNSVTPIDLASNTAGPEITVVSTPGRDRDHPGRQDRLRHQHGQQLGDADRPGEQHSRREITVGKEPRGIAITPNGKTAYVANNGSNSVTPIDLASNKAGAEIPVGSDPVGIAITPDGKTAYVTNYRQRHGDADRPGEQHSRRDNHGGQRAGRDRDHPGRQDRLRHQPGQQLGDADRRGEQHTRREITGVGVRGRDRDHPERPDRLRHQLRRQLGDADRPGEQHKPARQSQWATSRSRSRSPRTARPPTSPTWTATR